ncbi:ParB/RepB/Spo0J family partition protein [Sphingomonas kyeonggiensis]|uniref:ParB family chromosome partitioning protein n=1 Tax=Sphingomonas kyeonggiensis TaxID=1268553 RepID=A0A7W6JTX6_9SPHN|nr:ParB/RepB/Spo0J family partition protein [Sphingomonas kyeonggiensis]MBB4099450.1 ParB family chromosome partitioning protein [Sphingomonas kyeonggiensis]
MELTHIPLGKLRIAAVNMRDGKKPPDIADILPSVCARGVLVPLIVRPLAEAPDAEAPDLFEIVAGRRRYFAARTLAEETGAACELPCTVIARGDDAAALEASLIENFARENPHEAELWASFTKLVREGRTPDELAATFGFTERQVAQILALGNLMPRIRDLYRAEKIDVASVRFLTMATKAQQREWLAILADPACHAPSGHQLRQWLFGGQSISTEHALFDLAGYRGTIVADLFGGQGYFADSGQFWEAQRVAVEEKRQAYLADGWGEVVVLEPGQHFNSYEHQRTPKRKGGRVYIALSPRGEVVFHEGYLTGKEARKRAKGEETGTGERPARPELTIALGNYVDLHRHAAVRAALIDRPAVALRLLLAHAISGSHLFRVSADPAHAASDAIGASVAASEAAGVFALRQQAARVVLGFEDSEGAIAGAGEGGTAAIFVRLLALDDAQILAILGLVMAEGMASGSAVVEAAGHHLGLGSAAHFMPDDCLLDLLKDREVLVEMIGEVAGAEVAKAYAGEKIAVLRGLLRDCLSGANGRTKAKDWAPRWLAFPPAHYTARGGANAVRNWERVAASFAPQPVVGGVDGDGGAPASEGLAPTGAGGPTETEREPAAQAGEDASERDLDRLVA